MYAIYTRLRHLGKAVFLLAGLLALLLVNGCGSALKPARNAPYREMVLETTAYCPCGKCCGWKRTWYGRPVYTSGSNKGKTKKIGHTASGRRARRGTIAADTRLFPFGTIMYIPGYGYGRVEDRGGSIKGYRIDLFYYQHRDALKWGRQKKKVRVYL